MRAVLCGHFKYINEPVGKSQVVRVHGPRSCDDDAQSSEVLEDLFKTAKGCMTRMEKVTLALRLKTYIVPIHPASVGRKL